MTYRQLEDILYSWSSCRHLYKKPEVMLCYGVHSIKLATKEALGIRHLCQDPTCSVQEAFLQGLRGRAQGDPRAHDPDLILQAPSASESVVYCCTLFLLQRKGLGSVSCDFLKSVCLVDSVRCFSFPFSLLH